ncbi:MAG: PilW family protein [Nitrospirae bacterium]|nr:PilW family protein [Nitrospirota bacterium]
MEKHLNILKNRTGTTLVELMIAVTIFLIFLGVAYPTFTFLGQRMADVQTNQELTQKGQRILNYMAEELRLAGLFVGATPNVTLCGEGTATNSLAHTNGNPYDSLLFLTSEQVVNKTDNAAIPFLVMNAAAASGAASISVNATYANVSGLSLGGNATQNARAFVTFDTLAPTILNRAYQVTSFGGTSLAISPSLDQTLNNGSNVYVVMRKRFDVNGRDLRIVRWQSDCSEEPLSLLEAHDRTGGTSWGGVDALQFEYFMNDGNIRDTIAATDITNVKAINIWILVRSDFPEKDYTNSSIYKVGGATNPDGTVIPGITLPAFNDQFRRMLLSKRVEVKNLEK